LKTVCSAVREKRVRLRDVEVETALDAAGGAALDAAGGAALDATAGGAALDATAGGAALDATAGGAALDAAGGAAAEDAGGAAADDAGGAAADDAGDAAAEDAAGGAALCITFRVPCRRLRLCRVGVSVCILDVVPMAGSLLAEAGDARGEGLCTFGSACEEVLEDADGKDIPANPRAVEVVAAVDEVDSVFDPSAPSPIRAPITGATCAGFTGLRRSLFVINESGGPPKKLRISIASPSALGSISVAPPGGVVPEADGALADGALADGALADGALADGALADGALADGALPDGVSFANSDKKKSIMTFGVACIYFIISANVVVPV